MKAISLWQPWASFMEKGFKTIETRSWSTPYRGDLLICSALRKPKREECDDEETYKAAIDLPYGFALCVVELFDINATERFVVEKKSNSTQIIISQQEFDMGNYTPGRFAWMTRNRRPLNRLPWRGQQGLWTLSKEEVELVGKNTRLIARQMEDAGRFLEQDGDQNHPKTPPVR